VTYQVEFTSTARRDIAKLPTRIAWAVLEFCTGPLAENPYRVGKPMLADMTGLYSARRGEYRIIYSIQDEKVVVEVTYVRHRSVVRRPR
jgi:mRNA interferase RelE/StbE